MEEILIPNNTLVRDKAKSLLKEENTVPMVKKMDTDDLQGDYHYRRRVNQMIKKRTTSLLKGDSISLDETADLLELLHTRLVIEGYSLDDALSKRDGLNEKFGSYSKKLTTTSSIETNQDFFIPYTSIGKAITDKDHRRRSDRLYEDQCY